MKNTILTFITLFFFGGALMAQEELQIGDRAPNFSLKNVDGRMISLTDYDDQKGVIVIFTCNHCPYSIAYEDRIIEIDQIYAPLGFPVVAINPNDPNLQPEDSYEEMIKRSQEKNFPFPYLFDKGQKVYPQYGATRTPHVFLLENKGDYFEIAYVGTIDDNYQNVEYVEEAFLEWAIVDLLEGKKVRNNHTKAIGCTIKTRKKF